MYPPFPSHGHAPLPCGGPKAPQRRWPSRCGRSLPPQAQQPALRPTAAALRVQAPQAPWPAAPRRRRWPSRCGRPRSLGGRPHCITIHISQQLQISVVTEFREICYIGLDSDRLRGAECTFVGCSLDFCGFLFSVQICVEYGRTS